MPESNSPLSPAAGVIRVVLADDHPLVRMGLRQVFAEEPDIRVEGEAANAEELLQLLLRGRYNVILLDMSMPGRSGLELLPELRQAARGTPILVLSMHPEEEMAVRAIRAGAAGYLAKGCLPEELVGAIRRLHSGSRYISPRVAEQLAEELSYGRDPSPHRTLSDREYAVLCLLGSGFTVSEIAGRLSLSAKTVSTYRARVLDKLHLATSAQLIHYAVSNNLVV